MTRPLSLLSVLLLLASLVGAGPAEARPRGFGGFGGGRTFSRPSFGRSPFTFRPSVRPPTTYSPPRATVPPPVVAPAPSLPPSGGFGSGRARGVVGAPGAPPTAASVPPTGGFGGGEARGVMGANAKKPISSAPPTAASPSAPPGPRGGNPISSRPAAQPQSVPSPGNVYRDYRRVEPVRGSPNVYVYDRRPAWGFMPFWWYPPIYTPGGVLVSPGGANPLGIFLTLAVIAVVAVMLVTLLRRR